MAMLQNEDITAVIDALNRFQEDYINYDVPCLEPTELRKIVGSTNYERLLKLFGIAKLQNAEHFTGAVPTPGEVIDPRLVRLNIAATEVIRKINFLLYKDGYKPLVILSGYRSPAYQLLMLCRELYDQDFELVAVNKIVKLPSYSEHNDPLCTAIDFNINDREDQRFKWLVKNAKGHGLFLSYPEDNHQGMIFEPWHWRFMQP